MKLTVRGFKKETLLQNPNHKTQPLMGLGKSDRKSLNTPLGVTQVKGVSVKVVPGKDGFIALTKKLREKLRIDKGNLVNMGNQGEEITIEGVGDEV